MGADPAEGRARKLYPRSKGFRDAYVRGARARRSKRPITDCPYKVKPGKTSWRNTWRLAWRRGWYSEDTAVDES